MKQSNLTANHTDNRLLGLQNDYAVLKLIHEWGHLRRSEIGRGVWPRSPAKYTMKVARRVVRRLLESGLLIERANSLAGQSLVLSNRGALRLQAIEVEARSGYDLSNVAGPQFFHRTLGTCYLLERAALGDVVCGEYAINTGRGMVSRAELSERFRKVPDGLATVPGQARGLDPSLRAADWTEVESSYKRASDLDRIWGVAYRVGEYLNDHETVVLDRVIIVYDATQRHERMLLNHLERYIRAHPVSNTEGILDSIVLVNCNIGLPLVFKGYTERTVLDVLSTSRHRRC